MGDLSIHTQAGTFRISKATSLIIRSICNTYRLLSVSRQTGPVHAWQERDARQKPGLSRGLFSSLSNRGMPVSRPRQVSQLYSLDKHESDGSCSVWSREHARSAMWPSIPFLGRQGSSRADTRLHYTVPMMIIILKPTQRVSKTLLSRPGLQGSQRSS